MATNPPTLAETLDPKSIHGFFKTLPKELRDIVYDLTYQKVETEYSRSHLCVSTPVVELRLVSRQFKSEYDDRCSKNEHLGQIVFKGAVTQRPDSDSENETFFKFPTHATRATDLVGILKAYHCEDDVDQVRSIHADLFRYRDWMWEVTAQLPRIGRIKVYLECSNCSCAFLSIHCLIHIARNPKVKRVEVLQPGQLFVEGIDKKALATWTTELGAKRDEEIAQQCLKRLFNKSTSRINKAITASSSGN